MPYRFRNRVPSISFVGGLIVKLISGAGRPEQLDGEQTAWELLGILALLDQGALSGGRVGLQMLCEISLWLHHALGAPEYPGDIGDL
jgi:hypothetical protein